MLSVGSSTKSTGFTVSSHLSLAQSNRTDFDAGVGPAAGAVIAVVFYKMIKILEYEVANPGQDEASEKGAAEAAAEAEKKETV